MTGKTDCGLSMQWSSGAPAALERKALLSQGSAQMKLEDNMLNETRQTQRTKTARVHSPVVPGALRLTDKSRVCLQAGAREGRVTDGRAQGSSSAR